MLSDPVCFAKCQNRTQNMPRVTVSRKVRQKILPLPLNYTDSRFLPFALLRLMILLPALVDILFRKPCVLARLIRLG